MSFVLFWRCIICSGRSSSCLPRTIKLHSPFSPFSPRSSTSASHTPLNVISDFLTKECGFSSAQVTTVMRLRPTLLRRKSNQTAREAIHLLKDSGFTENQLKSTILRNPNILVMRVDRQLRPKMEFLKEMGLATQDIAYIVFHKPRLLGLSLENCLAPRILHLETLFGSKDHLCKAIRRAPLLLTSDFKKQVMPRVEYLKNTLGILEDSAVFARALNVVIRLSFETLEKKTKHMASLGLAEEEISQIIKRHPEALGMSTNKIKESIDFLIHTVGLEPKNVALNPVLFNLSIEKRLKPRYEVFQSVRTSPHAKGLPGVIKFFLLSERAFLAKFSQYNIHLKSKDHTLS